MKHLHREAWRDEPGPEDLRTEQGLAAAEGRGRGRPRVHAQQWRRATVVLFDSLIAYLDHLAADIRLATGAAMNRAEIIRGLIGGLQQSTLDVTGVTSEAELRALVAARLSGAPAPGPDGEADDTPDTRRRAVWQEAPL